MKTQSSEAQLGWQSCQLYALATIYPKEIPLFLLLFAVECGQKE